MLSPLLMLLMLIMDMDITLVMPTMDTLDTHMPTTMDTTMARGPLMLSQLLLLSPRLMLLLSTDMDTDLLTTDMAMLTMDTMDTHMPTMDTTMARGLLMLSPLLMLPMLIMDMDITLAMPTMDTMDTHMPTVDTSMDKMDIIINLFVKNLGFSSVKLVTPSHIDHC